MEKQNLNHINRNIIILVLINSGSLISKGTTIITALTTVFTCLEQVSDEC